MLLAWGLGITSSDVCCFSKCWQAGEDRRPRSSSPPSLSPFTSPHRATHCTATSCCPHWTCTHCHTAFYSLSFPQACHQKPQSDFTFSVDIRFFIIFIFINLLLLLFSGYIRTMIIFWKENLVGESWFPRKYHTWKSNFLLWHVLMKPARGAALPSLWQNWEDWIFSCIRQDLTGEGSVSFENLRQPFSFHSPSSFFPWFYILPSCLFALPWCKSTSKATSLYLPGGVVSPSGVRIKRKEKGSIYLKLLMDWSPGATLLL